MIDTKITTSTNRKIFLFMFSSFSNFFLLLKVIAEKVIRHFLLK